MAGAIVWVEIPVLDMKRALSFYNAVFLPSENGPWLYMYSEDPLAEVLARVAAAGGEILTPHTAMGEAGSYTAIRDTGGNTIALYQPPPAA